VVTVLHLAPSSRQPFVFFQIILTVANSAHGFVILSVFSSHLTNDLNPSSPVYSKCHVCYKKVNRANNRVCLLFHILLTSQPFHTEIYKNVFYIFLPEVCVKLLNRVMVELVELYSLFLIYCVVDVQEMDYLTVLY